ncbi:ubiquinone biosynthesis accessory factor UbiJ [Paludibacterium purpuratum]|uniref:Ubiquinone biosynthesis accessory factor UbiJ n=1 Tax=Paludibacterium purpuratum TaxID=1144873 RepID=A0A4R7B1J5_9NEIS|nr:sterol-binding protein [Paludibacterium purpuratum]TDR73518.1 ubiquinone biosynthesis protein UbiJ [Paludibacterium purpuratum]
MQPILALFNHILGQHPEVRAELAELAGRRVALAMPPMTLSGVITDVGLLAASAGEPEATVRVKPLAALSAQWSGRVPDFSDLELAGDNELAQRFGHLAGQLRWLPVEDLSGLLGDAAAHRIEGWLRRSAGFKGAVAWRVLDSWIEHLRDEMPLLTHKRDVERFVAAVDALRDDAARLEKRLARLEAERGSRSEPASPAVTPCG